MLSPKQKVIKKFESKQSLANDVVALLDGLGAGLDSDEKESMVNVSHAKLLRLHEVADSVKSKHGSKDSMIDAIVKLKSPLAKKVDEDYRNKLVSFPIKRLWDLYRSLARKA